MYYVAVLELGSLGQNQSHTHVYERTGVPSGSLRLISLIRSGTLKATGMYPMLPRRRSWTATCSSRQSPSWLQNSLYFSCLPFKAGVGQQQD